jgi:putative ABC transport system substrate-binding protein
MKKVGIIATVALAVVVAAVVSLCVVRNDGVSRGRSVPHKSFRLAVITPTTHPSLEQIQQGFKDTLDKDHGYTYAIDVFNANGNRMLLSSLVEEVARGGYDLVFTIASQPTLLTKQAMGKHQKSTPIVFGAVSDPVRLGVVQSLSNPGGQVTGVYEEQGAAQQVPLIKMLHPTTRNVLLVYNPSQGSGLEVTKGEVESNLNALGMKLIPLPVYATNEVYSKLQASIGQADMVMVLKDNTVVSALDGVIKLCNTKHIPLMASDLDSVAKGAVMGFGVHEYQYGVRGAGLAQRILKERLKPAQLPCIGAGEHRLCLNRSALATQRLAAPQALLSLLSIIEVIRSSDGGSDA